MITIEKIFDHSARNYSKTEEVRFASANLKTIRDTIRYLRSSDHVLDFGCATGTKVFQLAGYAGNICGIDISGKMIKIARKRLSEGAIKNVEFFRGGIFDDRLKPGSYDVILAFNILHLLENASDTLERIRKLLKHGGTFISTTVCLGEQMKFKTKMQFYLFVLMQKAGLFPKIERYRFTQLEKLITGRDFRIIETIRGFNEMNFEFIAAKKSNT